MPDSFKDHAIVKDVLVWSESTEARGLVGRCLVGGYYNYPSLPSTVAGIKSCFKDQVVGTACKPMEHLTCPCDVDPLTSHF